MNGYNFTERVRKVLAFAREEAAAIRHEHVGTEHILLALIRDGEGVGHAVLQNLTRDADAVRARVLERLRPSVGASVPVTDLPYTSVAKKTLEFAMAEARDLKHSYVGTEHLLLGLIREQRGIASQVLSAVGVDLDAARAETIRLLGPGPAGDYQRFEEPAPGNSPPIPTLRCRECDVDMDRGHFVAGRLGRRGSTVEWESGIQPGRSRFNPNDGSALSFDVIAFRCPKCGVLRLISPPA